MKLKWEKFLEHGIYFLALILPIQTRLIIKTLEIQGAPLEYGTVSIYLTDVFLLGLLALFLIYYFSSGLKIKENLKLPLYWWILAGLDLVLFLSIFWSQDKILAVYNYLVFLLGVGLLFLIIKAKFNKLKFIYFFLVGLSLQALWGIFQFLNQYAPGFKYLGLASHDPENLGVSVVETIGADGLGRRWLRAYGGLDHPNILGAVLALGLLLALILFIQKHFSGAKREGEQKYYLLEYLFLLILTGGLFFSFSRAAWLGFLAGLVVLGLGFLFQKKWRYLQILGKAVGFLSILIIALSLTYPTIVKARLGGEGELEQRSNRERIASLKEAKEIIKDNWLFGVGAGNYTLALKEKEPGKPGWYYQPVHNTFLLLWAETGILGIFLGIAFFLFLFIQSLREFSLTNLSLLVSLFVLMMFEHWWWSLHFGVLILGLLAGLMLRNLKKV